MDGLFAPGSRFRIVLGNAVLIAAPGLVVLIMWWCSD
jgi:hypothetical protein